MHLDARREIRRLGSVIVSSGFLISCGGHAVRDAASRASQRPEIGVVPAVRKNLQRTLVVSSELVPFQQIDVYAKESGFVRTLNVDYGTRVRAGAVLATLEIPELQAQIEEDDATINAAISEMARARQELARDQAEQNAAHLQSSRLTQVAETRPGLVAQQEVDDWQSRDQAATAQVAATRSALEAAAGQLARARARLHRDQVLFDYSRITAPFAGVVTKRYANLGTLLQSGTNSSTQAMPLVQLSEEDLFRLVIPVPESYVPDIVIGAAVAVRVPALNRSFPGKVARTSVNLALDTRTMHTEVDVANPNGALSAGLYAEATLTLDRRNSVLAVPQEAVNIRNQQRTVWVVDPSGAAHLREVTVGVETPDDVEIVSGLKEGELVVVGDRSRLQTGEMVRPKQIELLHFHG